MNMDYLLAEYESLRTEIMQNQQQRVANERYGAAAIIAIYAWLLSDSDKADSIAQPLLWFGWWLPFFIALFGFLRSKALHNGIHTAGGYLADLQTKLELEGLGWERHIREMKENNEKKPWLSWTSMTAWLCAIALTWIIAVTATALLCSSRECSPSGLNGLFG